MELRHQIELADPIISDFMALKKLLMAAYLENTGVVEIFMKPTHLNAVEQAFDEIIATHGIQKSNFAYYFLES